MALVKALNFCLDGTEIYHTIPVRPKFFRPKKSSKDFSKVQPTGHFLRDLHYFTCDVIEMVGVCSKLPVWALLSFIQTSVRSGLRLLPGSWSRISFRPRPYHCPAGFAPSTWLFRLLYACTSKRLRPTSFPAMIQ
jgi:hypothetical protein